MVERWRIPVFAAVLVGHGLIGWWLARAMPPPPVSAPDEEHVLYIELVSAPQPVSEPEPVTAEIEPSPVEPEPEPPPTRLPPRRIRMPAPPMQAVIETAPEAPPARELVDPARDPFSQPPAAPRAETGFGRRDLARMPSSNVPQLPGALDRDPGLARLPARQRIDARKIVDVVGAFIGGGPNAPVELPCGSRVNDPGAQMNESFSPAWNKHYGCGEDAARAGYDGRAQQPPGTVR